MAVPVDVFAGLAVESTAALPAKQKVMRLFGLPVSVEQGLVSVPDRLALVVETEGQEKE